MPVVYYIRHGETDFNVEGRLQGRRDTELNARGRRQAAHAAEVLRDLLTRDRREPSDVAYAASPLKRARQTMEAMRATLGLAPHDYILDDRLMEIAYGTWEGLTLPEIDRRMPGMLEARERNKWDFAAPGGESYRELSERIAAWYAELSQDTVVAAHGGGVRVLMALLGLVPRDEATHAAIAQGVVYVFANGTMARYA